MIGKAKCNVSTGGTIAYNDKEHGELIYTANLFGESLLEYKMEISDLQKCYRGSASNMIIHSILSPAIADGYKFTPEDWSAIAKKFLKEMKLEDYQAIFWVHKDRGHLHLHGAINRVHPKTLKIYRDAFIGRKASIAADRIAENMGITRASIVRQEKIISSYRFEEAKPVLEQLEKSEPIGSKQSFVKELEEVLVKPIFSVEEYWAELRKRGFKIHTYMNSQTGVLRGYAIEKNGTAINASVIGKKFTLNSIQTTIKKNQGKSYISRRQPHEKLTTRAFMPKGKMSASLKVFAESLGILKPLLADEIVKFVSLDNRYYLGIKNDSGGYFLQNKFEIKQVGAKDITTIIKNPTESITVLDSLIDYLKAKERAPGIKNFIILNSYANKVQLLNKMLQFPNKQIILKFTDDLIGKLFSADIKHVASVRRRYKRKEGLQA